MLKTKELTVVGLMGALMFSLSLLVGTALNAVTGNPLASGLVTSFIQAIVIIITNMMVKKFWVNTSIWGIYGILAIPTTLLGGLPGILKVILALSIGFLYDVVVRLDKYKVRSFFLGFVVISVMLPPLFVAFYYLAGLPVENMIKFLPVLLVVYLSESLIGAYLGLKLFYRIRDKKVIRQFMG